MFVHMFMKTEICNKFPQFPTMPTEVFEINICEFFKTPIIHLRQI